MLYSNAVAKNAFKIISATRSFHLGHEYAPPARFISHHARFALALLSTAIQLSGLVIVYLNADKLRPPPPRKLNEEAEAEMERLAPLFKDGMAIKKF
uniref:Uncharacterized protein n=1 Tax=Setaria digitata TaxID=48799 RepID=A0A915PEH2_9BILA